MDRGVLDTSVIVKSIFKPPKTLSSEIYKRELRNFKRLIEIGKSKTITLKEKPVSASVWCGMFSGKTPEEHKHESYVDNGEIVKRENIKVDFIWDILNVPFVVPPYSFRVDFKPIGFGLSTNEKEWNEELERVTEKTKFLIEEKPDLLISVYTCLDRFQHFHWGESFGEAKVQTLPEYTKEGKLKGDHHENALLITENMDYEIERPQDVFFVIKEVFY